MLAVAGHITYSIQEINMDRMKVWRKSTWLAIPCSFFTVARKLQVANNLLNRAVRYIWYAADRGALLAHL